MENASSVRQSREKFTLKIKRFSTDALHSKPLRKIVRLLELLKSYGKWNLHHSLDKLCVWVEGMAL